jgi:DNA-binding CsgD family transcriptional regulator
VIVRPVLCRPFIGRRQELAFLNEKRLEAARSRGGLVLVEGDAGVGKTRLVGEFCKSLAYSRWRIGTGACLEFANRPYGPIVEALSQAGGTPFTLAAAATKRDQFDQIVERLASIASRRAVIAVIEDVHWADAATLELLAYLAPQLHRMRVLVIASVRTDELHTGREVTTGVAKIARNARAARIELGRLRGIELQRFIDEALGAISLPDETRRAVALAGDGNPFFTEELLKSAVERTAGGASDRGGHELPQTVSSTLLERLRPFDEAQRRVIGQAAVIGRTFDLELLAATLQLDAVVVLPALRRARDVQLVAEIGPNLFRFRHGLTREAIYGEFLSAELQPRHRTIALVLESAPAEQRSVEALAYHWWAAGDEAKARAYNELAGDAAAKIHAHEDAIVCYERALSFDMEAANRGAIVKKIADARLALVLTREAHATYCAAADAFAQAGDRESEAACRATAAITAYGIGLPNPTEPLEAMLTRLNDDEYLAISRVHLGLAWLAATFGFPTRAADHLARVDPRALSVPAIALRFYNVSAFVAMTFGDAPAFRKRYADWLAAAQSSPSSLAGAYTNGAMCCAFFGWHEEAAQQIESALRAAREARSRHAEESAHAFAAMCALLRGDLPGARAELEHVSPASENNVNITFATAWGSIVAAALDDRALIEKWFDGFEERVMRSPEIECGGGFAEIMVRRGRVDDAAALLHRALRDCELIRGNVITLLAVGRYGAPADRKRARECLERAAAGATELVERPALLLFDAFECRREGREDQAVSLAREAAQGFERLRFPFFEAQAREAAGERDAAMAIFRRCGASYDVARLQRASGLDAAAALSAREREIAELAARGQSNLEIARQLSITHKTVEKHLGSAYQKLRINSRWELDAYLNPERTRV